MSRRVRFSPCAPIGGNKCAELADQRHAQAGDARGLHRAHRPCAERSVQSDGAQQAMRLVLDFDGQHFGRQGLQAQRLARRDQPDEAGAIGRALASAQRHEGEGAGALVKLGRNIVVRLLMRQQHGQRRLRIGPGIDRDPGDLPRLRIAAFACHNEFRLDPVAGGQPRLGAGEIQFEIIDQVFNERDVGVFARRFRQSGHQRVIVDILAKGVEVDLARAEFFWRGREDRAGVVDQADAFHRGGVIGQASPQAKSAEKTQRAFEQGDGAAGEMGLDLADDDDLAALRGEGMGGGKAGRASPRDQHVTLDGALGPDSWDRAFGFGFAHDASPYCSWPISPCARRWRCAADYPGACQDKRRPWRSGPRRDSRRSGWRLRQSRVRSGCPSAS